MKQKSLSYYAQSYRRAEVEPGVLCIVPATSEIHALQLIDKAIEHYQERGVGIVVNTKDLEITLENGSKIHYGLKASGG